MGNQLLLNSAGNRQLDRFYQRFSIIQRDPTRNVTFMQEKKTGHEYMLRELVTNDEFQKRRIEALVRQKRGTRNKFLLRLEDHFFDRDKTYCSSQFRAYLLFESHYKDLREEMLERRISKSHFEEEELLSVIESGVMGLRYLREIQQPHQCISSSSILISRDGLMMLSDPWLNPDVLQQCNHVYSSPQQLEAAANVQVQKFDWYASDLFSIGMVVLQAYHLEFMDDLYVKNARSLNHNLLVGRITAIRQPTLRRYVEQLLSAPQVRLAVGEEIAYQANKPVLVRSGSQPNLPQPLMYQSNLPKEQPLERQYKRVVSPDFARNTVMQPPPPNIRGTAINFSTVRQPHQLQQPQHPQPHQFVFKNVPQPQQQNIHPMRVPVQAPTVSQQHPHLTKYPQALVSGTQATTNFNIQNSQNSFRMNPVALSKLSPIHPKPYFVNDKPNQELKTERPAHLMTSRHEIRQKLNETEPIKAVSSVTDLHSANGTAKVGLHSMSFVKKNQNVTQASNPIAELQNPQPSSTISTFMNIRNRVNKSVTLNSIASTTSGNNGSNMTSCTSTEVTTPIGNSQLQQAPSPSVTSSQPLSRQNQNPSFIKKVPPPILQTNHFREANTNSSRQYRNASSPTYRNHQQTTTFGNSNISSSRMTSASRLQQLLSSPMSPSDMELFTKPELLEGICASTETFSPPPKDQYTSYIRTQGEPSTGQGSLPKQEVLANDFISNYIDRDYRYSEVYDSVQAKQQPVVPQLVIPQAQHYSAHSDRTNSGEIKKYKFNDSTYSVEFEYREVKTERIMTQHYFTEDVAAPAIKQAVKEEIKSIQASLPQLEYQEFSYPMGTKDAPLLIPEPPPAKGFVEQPTPDAQFQKQHTELQRHQVQQHFDTIAESDPALPPYPVAEPGPKTAEVSDLHFTHSEIDHEKPDSSNKPNSADLGQMNASNEQKYLLSYDMDHDNSKIKSDSGQSVNNSNSSIINAMNMTEPQPAILLQLNQAQNFIPKPMTPENVLEEITDETAQVVTPARSRPQTLQKYNSTIAEVSESDNSADVEDDGSEYIIEYYDIGSRYEGYKKNGMRNGKGKFYYQDGGFYEGQWKDNKMHGEGKLYYSESKLAYEGEWYLDEFHGHGKVYNDNPITLEVPFNYKDFDGLDEYWVYYEGTDSDDLGNLVTDTKQGFGRLKLSNGEVFEGEFRRDRIEGNGKFYTTTGEIISGLWKDSKLVKVLE